MPSGPCSDGNGYRRLIIDGYPRLIIEGYPRVTIDGCPRLTIDGYPRVKLTDILVYLEQLTETLGTPDSSVSRPAYSVRTDTESQAERQPAD